MNVNIGVVKFNVKWQYYSNITECRIKNMNSGMIYMSSCRRNKKDRFDKNYARKLSLARCLQYCILREDRKPFWEAYFNR